MLISSMFCYIFSSTKHKKNGVFVFSALVIFVLCKTNIILKFIYTKERNHERIISKDK